MSTKKDQERIDCTYSVPMGIVQEPFPDMTVLSRRLLEPFPDITVFSNEESFQRVANADATVLHSTSIACNASNLNIGLSGIDGQSVSKVSTKY